MKSAGSVEQPGGSSPVKKKSNWNIVLHPFLFATVPILFLYAFNIYEASFSDILLPLALSLGVTALLFFVLSAILKNRQEAGLLVTLILVLFFSFGHFIEGIDKVHSLKSLHIAWPLYALVFILGVFLIFRYRKNLKNATVILNVIAIAMVVMSLFNIATSTLKAAPTLPKLEARAPDPAAVMDKSKLPDIYYIIFDSYASVRTMKDYFGYDNRDLITFLRSKGFYVPAQARSNYLMTELSLGSSLNMRYLDFLSKNPGENSRDMRPLIKLMRENQVAKSLKSLGYSYTLLRNNLAIWNGRTLADRTPVKSRTINNDFMIQLFKTTMLRAYSEPALTFGSIVNSHREIFRRQLAEILKAASQTKGPDFVFAHIFPPHALYVFNKNGDMSVKQVKYIHGSKRLLKKGYLGQYIYVTKQIKKLVNSLLSGNGRKPIIIIQSDHGPRNIAVGDSDESDKSALQKIDRNFSILNAYYFPLPQGGTAKFYDTITPVNSFRELFNLYFKTNYQKLPDKSLLNTPDHLFKFIDLSQKIRKLTEGEANQ